MNSGIYSIKNKINGDCYIGSSKNLKRRKKDHFYLLSKNKSHCKLLQRAVNKYGIENFEFNIEFYFNVKDLFYYEQEIVDAINPKYNICKKDVSVPIGLTHSGYKHTKKHKIIKRKNALKRLKQNTNFGWKSRIIQKLDKNNVVISEYKSLKEYAKIHKCSIGNVGKALKNGNKCKGFHIKYK